MGKLTKAVAGVWSAVKSRAALPARGAARAPSASAPTKQAANKSASPTAFQAAYGGREADFSATKYLLTAASTHNNSTGQPNL
jgi:hypothetical protein